MSTPELLCATKNKYSPLGVGINKRFLTPCRQVGLSRKRKTPVNKLAKKLSEDLNTSSNISINRFSENDTTPVIQDSTTPMTHNKFLKRRKMSENSLSDLHTSSTPIYHNKPNTSPETLEEKCEIKLPKKDLLQSFTSDDLFDTSDMLSSMEDTDITENEEKSPRCLKNNIKQKSNEEFVANIKEKSLHLKRRDISQNTSDSNTNNQAKGAARKLSNNFTNFEDCLNNEKIACDDDFVIDTGSTNKNSSKRKHTKGLKKTQLSFSLQYDSLEDADLKSNSIKNCKIQLQKLSKEEISSTSRSSKTLTPTYKSNLMDDDSDFFTSTPEEEKLKRKHIEKKIKELESHLKQKRLVLENLQRASIYKSKHNIGDLKQLTSMWSGGCVRALKDLLTQLQAHGSIDLNTLLSNMRIPQEIVDKLPLKLE